MGEIEKTTEIEEIGSEGNVSDVKTEATIIPKRKSRRYNYKTCKVLSYNKIKKIAVIEFNGCGISVHSDDILDKTVKVKYTGELGKPDFSFEIVKKVMK